MRKKFSDLYWKEQKYEKKQQIKRDYSVEEILELFSKEIKQRIKSAVQGLLGEIENYPPEFIMEAETEKEAEKLKQEFIDLVKKWFPDVVNNEKEM